MPIPEDDESVMVEGWHTLLRMQERGRVGARRQSLKMVRRPFRRATLTDQEKSADG